mgnify:CR=1 FL=1
MTEKHEDLVRRHQQELDVCDTQTLVSLWHERYAGTLTGEGTEAFRRLLLERLGFLPPDLAVSKPLAVASVEPHRRPARSSTRTAVDPVYAPQRLHQISAGARIFSWLYLVGGLAAAATQLLQAFIGYRPADAGYILMTAALTALQAVFFFLVLQVMAEGVHAARTRRQPARQSAPTLSGTRNS